MRGLLLGLHMHCCLIEEWDVVVYVILPAPIVLTACGAVYNLAF